MFMYICGLNRRVESRDQNNGIVWDPFPWSPSIHMHKTHIYTNMHCLELVQQIRGLVSTLD